MTNREYWQGRVRGWNYRIAFSAFLGIVLTIFGHVVLSLPWPFASTAIIIMAVPTYMAWDGRAFAKQCLDESD